jgi:hypothetical protein
MFAHCSFRDNLMRYFINENCSFLSLYRYLYEGAYGYYLWFNFIKYILNLFQLFCITMKTFLISVIF